MALKDKRSAFTFTGLAALLLQRVSIKPAQAVLREKAYKDAFKHNKERGQDPRLTEFPCCRRMFIPRSMTRRDGKVLKQPESIGEPPIGQCLAYTPRSRER